ncbi:nicotinate-nucleotide adenylyltransferase [Ancylobacter sp. A5.8]|uniref:nicotinate-nucleotide adenylyltransferase n=1 Tax=Ancylobacter gelatini TaxID=2919920 RepID=UPI001F4EC605|nr:nicotinate-nucleotide adenylyltransferase [Ancylobacter gelatini]MCJ8144374.1 nicotinate-nucleotide adenylyltransferase [Ancylobacter gelatini]
MTGRLAAGAAPPEALRLPPVAPRMRIGLYGGTFNPAHAAHRAASLLALKRLRLDKVWWLVTPGNPLKDNSGLPPLAGRIEQARAVAHHPALVPTGCEALLGTRYSYDTVAALVRRFPQVDFVWLMGADNLASFHRWQRWRALAELVPIAVIDRPGSTFRAMASPAASALAPWRLDERQAPRLAGLQAPAWLFLHGLKSPLSSTLLREAAGRNDVPSGANAPKCATTVEKHAVSALS